MPRGQLTPEQRRRQRDGARRWQASRTEEEKRAAQIRRREATVSKRQRKDRGRLTGLNWFTADDDPVEDL